MESVKLCRVVKEYEVFFVHATGCKVLLLGNLKSSVSGGERGLKCLAANLNIKEIEVTKQ